MLWHKALQLTPYRGRAPLDQVRGQRQRETYRFRVGHLIVNNHYLGYLLSHVEESSAKRASHEEIPEIPVLATNFGTRRFLAGSPPLAGLGLAFGLCAIGFDLYATLLPPMELTRVNFGQTAPTQRSPSR